MEITNQNIISAINQEINNVIGVSQLSFELDNIKNKLELNESSVYDYTLILDHSDDSSCFQIILKQKHKLKLIII